MESPRQKSRNWVIWAVAALIVLCLCVFIIAIAGLAVYYFGQNGNLPVSAPWVKPEVEAPFALNRPDHVSTLTAEALGSTIVPENDPYDLACRLQALCGVERTLPAPTHTYALGDTRTFWVQNSDTIEHFQVETTLRYVTPHSYFWVEDGVEVEENDIAALMTTFEDKIYPTDREFFGSEWTPGVDNDPHIYVIYARGIGATTAGYYSSLDGYNPAIKQYSNAVEQFVFNADNSPLHDEYTYGILAHEFQHMIHWYGDRNEASWINEGFSELASFINGYSAGGSDWAYAADPDISLIDWTSLSDVPEVTTRHYGQAFLFMTYFLDRFGNEATQAVVKHPENGLVGIDHVLQELSITDPKTGSIMTADDVVLDWMLAMYLGDASVDEGRYAIHNYADAPQTSATDSIRDCPGDTIKSTVSQFGPDYVEIDCPGDHTLEFTGSTAADVLPDDPHSGTHAFWSNKGDESDMTLTREFDLTGVTGPVEFSYWTWYDLEEGWDYLYLEASSDGESWQILKTPSCSDQDQSGNAYGCGFTGKSGGRSEAVWINETVDLSAYAGKKVQLRFEYVTDAALNGEGLLLDDLGLKAINYNEDFEAGDGGWLSEGFLRMENMLPQTYRLALIMKGLDGTTVEYLSVRDDQTASIPVSLESGESAILLVTGTQRFTRLPASYMIEPK